MHVIRYLFYAVFVIVAASQAKAQSFRFSQYTTNNGLPVDNVFAAAQDGNGFMWFATSFGIAKFDGHSFINYSKKNGIENIAVPDIVYAGGDSILFISYPSTIQSIHSNGKINTLFEAPQFSFHQIAKFKDAFYCYHRNHNNYVVLQQGQWKMYSADSVLGGHDIKIHTIFPMGERGVAFCTSKGLYIKNEATVTHLLPDQNIQIGILTQKNTLMLVCDNIIIEADSNLVCKKTSLQLPKNFLPYQVAEENGNIWFRNIDKGILRLQNNVFEEMSNLLNMQGKTANKFFTDKDGNFWISTDGNGVLLKKKTNFDIYTTYDGLPNNKVLCLHQQNNSLYIGTENGIAIKDFNSIKPLLLPSAKEGLKYTFQIQKVTAQQVGLTIAHTFNFNVKGAGSYLKNHSQLIKAYATMFAWQEDEHNFWTNDVAAPKKIYKIENDCRFVDSVDISAYNIKKVYKMFKWEDFYWVGTDKGLLKFNREKKIFYKDFSGETIGQVFDIMPDQKMRLWIATETGLFFYAKGLFTALPKSTTMGSNYCTGITLDNDENIWVSTWDGLFVTNGVAKKYFNTNNGLPSKTVNTVFFDTASKQLYAGTDNGLAVLNKASLNIYNPEISAYLTCRMAAENSGNRLIKDGDELPASQNSLAFDLSIPYYQDNENIKYEYRLDNNSWTSSNNPTFTLSDISSGNHVVYARVRLNDAVLTKNETIFHFLIQTPYYKTWWFWVLPVLLVQFILFRIINRYNRRIREKKMAAQQQEAELASLKQQAFTSLMNPHFIFNALNSIQHYINKQDRLTANKYLSDFATLVRRSFDAAQKAFVPLDEELETVRLYLQLEKMRFTDKFNYSITLNKAAETEEWMLPGMVLQPFLENAILHGIAPLSNNGQINIDIKASDNTLYITITDNGIGIEKSRLFRKEKKHNSRGMELIKERLQILSKLSPRPIELLITELQGGAENPGTCIQLVIPQQVYEVYVQSNSAKHQAR